MTLDNLEIPKDWDAESSTWNRGSKDEKGLNKPKNLQPSKYEGDKNWELYKEKSVEELEQLLEIMQQKSKIFYNMEQSVKLMLNSMYGAFGNEWFYFYNLIIAETITIQGQDAILYIEAEINKYFKDLWFTDYETHRLMDIEVSGKVLNPAVIYIDTDSVDGKSILDVDKIRLPIEDFWKIVSKSSEINRDKRGNEIIKISNNILNYTDDKGLHYSPGSKIIRHKVNKPKWKIKTKSGKEIIITNDHSVMVKRDNILIKIKASEINKETDKILSVSKYIK